MSFLDFLTMDDLQFEDKTVFVRVDVNTPIDPQTGKLLELNRIKEAAVTISALGRSKVVVVLIRAVWADMTMFPWAT